MARQRFCRALWRTITYEEVYLRANDGVEEARQSIGRYIAFYNARQPHAALSLASQPVRFL
jgi:putative transposase